MLSMNNETHYQAYLLRLQRGHGQAHWRAMLRDAATGDERHFATERELVRFLLTTLQLENIKPENLRKEN